MAVRTRRRFTAQEVTRRRRVAGASALAVVLLLVLWAAGAFAGGPGAPSSRGSDTAGGGSASEGPVDATAFATGACMAYAPTSGGGRATVFLDAGHGGLDPGALGTTESGAPVTEASLTLPIELAAMTLLRAHGYRVVVSRTADTSVARLAAADVSGGELTSQGVHDDVAARAACADDAGAKVLVGIYLDAGASPDDAGSLAAYDAVRPFAAANERLATMVEDDVVSSLDAQGWDIPDDGVVEDSTVGSLSGDPASDPLAAAAVAYGHLLLLGPSQTGFNARPSAMPGTVVEPLFLTDPFEADVADSAAGQRAVAAGIAQAVEQFLGPTPG